MSSERHTTRRHRLTWGAIATGAAVVFATVQLPAGAGSGFLPQGLQTLPSAFDMPEGAGSGDSQGNDFRFEAIDRQTHTLALGASGSLEVKNVSGDITLMAGAGRDVSIEVVKRARGTSDANAKQGLSEVRVDVDHQGERATVAVVYPQQKQPPYSVEVSYVVTAPAGTRITATSVSGDVTARGITGDLVTASVSGDVQVSNVSRLTAKSVSGDVSVLGSSGDGSVAVASVSGDLQLDDIRAQRLNAESVSGSVVVTRAASAGANLKSVSGDIEFQGALTRGGRYEFQSHSGDVRANPSGPAGFELQASTFSGSLRTEPASALRAATTSRRSIRGTVGDGSAVLVATTFSGDVAIVTR